MSTDQLTISTPAASETRAAPSENIGALYRTLLDRRDADAVLDERPIQLHALDDLHFLDQHACLLLARACHTPVLILREAAPAHRLRRIAAHTLCANSPLEGARLYDYFDPACADGSEGLDYAPGALLRRALDIHRAAHLWHNYQTSRDRTLPPAPAGATLAFGVPHLRTGFVTGVDLFNRGEFYQAHEAWESLWMRLDKGAERSLAQGLIQLGGAHIHRLKNRPREARKLFNSARCHLETASAIDWLDVPALVTESETTFAAHAAAAIPLPSIPLHNTHANVARKHL